MPLSSSGLGLAVAAGFGWVFYDVARRVLSRRMTAWALVVWGTLAALPVLGVWAVAAGDWRLEPGYWAPALASVALNVAANFGYFRAYQLSPLSATLPMLSFTPLFASLLGALLLGEPMSARSAAGAALVVAGGLAVGLSSARGVRFEAGSAWMLGVAFLWSATLLLDKRALAAASPYVHALVLNAGVAAGGLAALVGARAVRELAGVRGNVRNLALAVAAGTAALIVQLIALGLAPVGAIETVKRGVGGFAAVLVGRLLFEEELSARKLGGVTLMTAGVALLLI